MNLQHMLKAATHAVEVSKENDGMMDSNEGIDAVNALEDAVSREDILALIRVAIAAVRWRRCDVCPSGQCAGHDDLADAADALSCP